MFSWTKKIVFSAVIALAVLLPSQLLAATLSVRPSAATYAVGNSFTVDIVVDSADQALNAVSGQLSFPIGLLEVASISKAGSVLSYWVKEPVAGVGVIDFEGIVPNPGFRGNGGKIVTINFRAKQLGQAPVTFTTGSVLANDGAGTNILTDLRSGTFDLRSIAPAPGLPPVNVNIKLPSAPQITSATHPDSEQWYNKKDAEFAWPLKSDITGVNILADKSPTSDPGASSDGLFSTYKYKNLTDGTRYLHVKFRNIAGWGSVSHFKFNIDTVEPEDLIAKLGERATTTDPKILLQLSASDALSGLDHYAVQINDSSVVDWPLETDNVYDLTLSTIGENKITVTAFDRAGNIASTSVTVSLEAAPVVVTLPECPVVVAVSWHDSLKALLTPELLLAASIGAGLVLLLIMIGLSLGRLKQRHSVTAARAEQQVEGILHQIFNSLHRHKSQQIDILELAKTRRNLTPEETLILEQLKRELTDIAKKLK